MTFIAMFFLNIFGQHGEPSPLFLDEFDQNRFDVSWRWLREKPGGWKLADGVLQIRTNGNLWEGENDQENILLRKTPAEGTAFQITVRSDLMMDQQYEHGGLIVYLDDDNWVTLTLLQSNRDNTQMIMLVYEHNAIGRGDLCHVAPYQQPQVDLLLVKNGARFTGHFRASPEKAWTKMGEFEYPEKIIDPHIGIVAGQGQNIHWLRFDDFKIFGDDYPR